VLWQLLLPISKEVAAMLHMSAKSRTISSTETSVYGSAVKSSWDAAQDIQQIVGCAKHHMETVQTPLVEQDKPSLIRAVPCWLETMAASITWKCRDMLSQLMLKHRHTSICIKRFQA